MSLINSIYTKFVYQTLHFAHVDQLKIYILQSTSS